jgi:hypothetical protein
VGPHHINGPARLKASESTQTSKAWVRASGCQFESIKTCTDFWSVIQQHLTDQLAINFPSPGHSKTQNACCWEGPFRLLNHPRSHKLFFLSFPGLHTYLPTYLPLGITGKEIKHQFKSLHSVKPNVHRLYGNKEPHEADLGHAL